MDKNELKIYLKDNPELIEKVLENIGCHHIKVHRNKRVQCALPSGDNVSSVSIKLNDSLSSDIYTKSSFNERENKDFIEVVSFITGKNFSDSLYLIYKVLDLKRTSRSVDKKNESSSANFLKRYKKHINKTTTENIVENPLPEWFKEQFMKSECRLFSNDGVSKSSLAKFDVRYDVLLDRIVFPIRNDNGEILTFKGRTTLLDYKILGIPKFIYYYPFDAQYYLYGYYENYYDILYSDEILIGESEKFVMQLDSIGINNSLATSKKVISDFQVKKILKIGKPICICYDKDVTLEEIFIQCRKFKGLIEISYVYDYDNLLSKKESPTDKGKEVFLELLNKYKFKYNGE